MKIKILTTDAQLTQAYSVMHELRTALTFNDFLARTREAATHDGYTVVGVFDDTSPKNTQPHGDDSTPCLAVMGYRTLTDLLHGRHLYIDDLVVAESHRSRGLGKLLLDYAQVQGRELQCTLLRLCTGLDNKGGIKFYEREGWLSRACVFKKPL
jgi:ribosomal protein S18 acetylase RimI-like enzyme